MTKHFYKLPVENDDDIFDCIFDDENKLLYILTLGDDNKLVLVVEDASNGHRTTLAYGDAADTLFTDIQES